MLNLVSIRTRLRASDRDALITEVERLAALSGKVHQQLREAEIKAEDDVYALQVKLHAANDRIAALEGACRKLYDLAMEYSGHYLPDAGMDVGMALCDGIQAAHAALGLAQPPG